jgi:hypothetical protein
MEANNIQALRVCFEQGYVPEGCEWSNVAIRRNRPRIFRECLERILGAENAANVDACPAQNKFPMHDLLLDTVRANRAEYLQAFVDVAQRSRSHHTDNYQVAITDAVAANLTTCLTILLGIPNVRIPAGALATALRKGSYDCLPLLLDAGCPVGDIEARVDRAPAEYREMIAAAQDRQSSEAEMLNERRRMHDKHDKHRRMLDERSRMLDKNRRMLDKNRRMLVERRRMLDERSRRLGGNRRELDENRRRLDESRRELDEHASALDENRRTLDECRRMFDECTHMIAECSD